jgi:hypothetical protein
MTDPKIFEMIEIAKMVVDADRQGMRAFGHTGPVAYYSIVIGNEVPTIEHYNTFKDIEADVLAWQEANA